MTIHELILAHQGIRDKSMNEIYVWFGDIVKITKASFGTWNGQEITILHMESDRKGNK